MNKSWLFWGMTLGALSGCSNPSQICISNEAVNTLKAEAKSQYALFADIRDGTAEPPFKNDKVWIGISNNINTLKAKSQDLQTKIDGVVATCVAMPDESFNGNFERNARQQSDTGDLFGAINAFGIGLAASAVAAGISQMSPAEKRMKIWTPMCKGDFSSLHDDAGHGASIADVLFPKRYAFWYNHIEKNNVIKSKLDLAIAIKQSELSTYETKSYADSFEKVIYDVREASLISNNDQETSFKCSANLYGKINGYVEAHGNINYNVNVTAEGGRKASIEKDDDYYKIMPTLEGDYD